MRPTRYYSDKQEKHVAKAVGGKQTANSGATAFSKGDVRTDLFLIECKTVVNSRNSITVQRDWIRKNEDEAFAMGKLYSAVAISFDNTEQFYIIDEKLFKHLVEVLQAEELG